MNKCNARYKLRHDARCCGALCMPPCGGCVQCIQLMMESLPRQTAFVKSLRVQPTLHSCMHVDPQVANFWPAANLNMQAVMDCLNSELMQTPPNHVLVCMLKAKQYLKPEKLWFVGHAGGPRIAANASQRHLTPFLPSVTLCFLAT